MASSGRVLITGGTGLVGSHLIPMLQERAYEISVLSRNNRDIPGANVYQWNPEKDEIDILSIRDVDVVIHLAGAGIGEKRWTRKRKAEILNSRTNPVYLLARKMKEVGSWPKTFISASGISLYDQQDLSARHTEKSPPKESFLASVVKEWEKATDVFASAGCRTVRFRTGLVLDSKAGALPKMAAPVKLGAGCVLGSGKQWMSWIHIQDICGLYLAAVENAAYRGVYNAVAPGSIPHQAFMKTLCSTLDKPLHPIRIPGFILKTALGEMASVLLDGSFCVNERIRQETDFTYDFPDLESALIDLYK